MLSFTTLVVAASAVLGANAAPTATTPEDVSRVRKRNTPNETGTSGGFYYQFCKLCRPHIGLHLVNTLLTFVTQGARLAVVSTMRTALAATIM